MARGQTVYVRWRSGFVEQLFNSLKNSHDGMSDMRLVTEKLWSCDIPLLAMKCARRSC